MVNLKIIIHKHLQLQQVVNTGTLGGDTTSYIIESAVSGATIRDAIMDTTQEMHHNLQ